MTTKTMWHRAFTHTEDTKHGSFGDKAVGRAVLINYRKDGEPWVGAEIAYYPEYIRATNQPGQPMRYVNTCRVEVWKGNPEHDDLEQWRESNVEIDYPDGDVLYYETLEAAQRAVDRYGKMDESDIFLM